MASTARPLREAIATNLDRLRERLRGACARSGRDPASVALVAVTKYAGPEVARALVALGQVDLGENRSERIERLAPLVPGARWHMVGHLQRNKARKVAGLLAALHSLDSLDLAAKLEARRRELGLPPLPVHVEVNVGAEPQKSGLPPDAAAVEAFGRALAPLAGLSVVGLMAIPPEAEDPEAARPHFARLRGLLPALSSGLGRAATSLSMGMTHDLEAAVLEGSTVVRVGRALLEGIPEDALAADVAALAVGGEA